ALAAGSLPLALIAPLLTQVSTQGAIELRHQQGKAALDVLVDRDRKLIDYLQQQQILAAQITEIQAFLDRENRQLTNDIASPEAAWLAAEPEAIEQLNNILKHDLDRDKQKVGELQTQLLKLEAELDFLDRQIAEAASPEEYQKLDELLNTAQKELFDRTAAFEAGQRRYDEITKTIEKTKKELAKYSEQTIDRANNEHIINSVAKVQETLQLFRERLTLKKLNKLEGEITECFRYLLHKSELVHRVAIDTNSFSLSLYDPNGQPVPKHRLSAGEKQLLAIAFLWGLARVSGRNLPVAIDTPLGRLDSSHRSNLVERYFPTASHQVILLSTDTEIGKVEVEQLRSQDAIAREYLLKYEPDKRQTSLQEGYFW
ncbi:MAG: DNA sulfur modification protein DndD, partial [Hydrococcus sp. CSU_1_8]|nr:DNA sulfur modification protein DndD [Hydrococcus sp. CSU_1_8]